MGAPDTGGVGVTRALPAQVGQRVFRLLQTVAGALCVFTGGRMPLFGARSKDWPPEVMDAQDEALIRGDIGRLDEVRLGLGEQVIDYICPG